MSGFLRKSVLIGAAELLCRVPLVFTVGYMARTIGPEAYGNWTMMVALQTFLAGLVSLGLSSSLSRFVPVATPGVARGYLALAFSWALGGVLLALAATLVLRQPLARALDIAPGLDGLIPVVILLVGATAADGYLDAYFKARMAVGRQVGFILSRTIAEVVAVFAVFPFGAAAAESLGRYMAIVVATKAVLYFLLVRDPAAEAPRMAPAERRAFLSYGLHFVPTVVVAWFIASSDRIILNQLVSKHELGVYVFAASLAAYFSFLGSAVFPLLLPRASQLYDQGDLTGVQAAFQISQRLFLKLWMGAMAGVALFAGEVIDLTAGANFGEARLALVVLCFSVGVDQYLGVYQWVFHLVKKPYWIFRLYLLQSGLLAAVMAVSVHFGGIAWAPYAALVGTLLLNAFRYSISRRYLALELPMRAVLSILAAGTVIYAVAVSARDFPLLARFALFAAIALALLFQLARTGSFPGANPVPARHQQNDQ